MGQYALLRKLFGDKFAETLTAMWARIDNEPRIERVSVPPRRKSRTVFVNHAARYRKLCRAALATA